MRKKTYIPDEEEWEPEPIDFTWYYFIGRTKLGLSFKEVGRMTKNLFNKLYKHYKDNFDLEIRLKNANVTYEEAYNSTQEKEWF